MKQEITPFYSVVVVFSKDKKQILLGKRKEDQLWTSPAGGGEIGETPEETAVRELFEESNIECKAEELKHLTSTMAGNGKPIFIYTLIPKNVKNIHVKNDPDKEVPKWKWFDLDKMPALDKNRQTTVNMAKMKMKDLIKAIVSTDMATGVDLYTQDYSQDDMASRDTYWYEVLSKLVEGAEINEPMIEELEKDHSLHIFKIGEGLYSGNIKHSDTGDKVINFNELSIASLVQMLKAKEFIGSNEAYRKESPPEGDSDVSVSAPGVGDLGNLIDSLKNVKVEGDLNITIQKSLGTLISQLSKAATPVRGKRGFPIGTKRTWSNGVTAVKHADGWVVIGGEHHGKLVGKFKTEARAPHLDAANEKNIKDAKQKVTDIEAEIARVKAEHEAKQKAITAEHEAKIAKLREDHAEKQKQDKLKENVKKIKDLEAKLQAKEEEAANEKKKQGSKTQPEDSEEGARPDKNETKTPGGNEGAGDAGTKGPEGVSVPKNEESEVPLTEEQKRMRERSKRHFETTKEYMKDIGSKTLKEYIAHVKADVSKDIKERYPSASDAEVKSALTRHQVTKMAKNRYKGAAHYADKYGIPVHPTMRENIALDKAKEGIKKEIDTKEESKLINSELNKSTNMVKSINFAKTSKKNADVLMRHLNDSNKIIESMGIKFKTPLEFRCDRLGNDTKSVRASYVRSGQGSRREVVLKDKAAANKSVMHEIGHGLDDALSADKGFRSHNVDSMPSELAKDYKELLELVTNSDYYKDYEGESHYRYLAKPTEVFARAFEVHSLVKAEELLAKGQISKDFLESFIPDVFKQQDNFLKDLRKDVKTAIKTWKEQGSEYGGENHEAYKKATEKVANRVKELGGQYVEVSKEKQEEYKTKISTIMDRILASDEIKKALNLLSLIEALKTIKNA